MFRGRKCKNFKKMLILLPPIDDVVENPMYISAEDIGQKKVAKQANGMYLFLLSE